MTASERRQRGEAIDARLDRIESMLERLLAIAERGRVTLPGSTVPAQRARDGSALTWAVTWTGSRSLWPGLDTVHWWRTEAMTDEFRTMERHGYRLMLHPSNNTCLVERVPVE